METVILALLYIVVIICVLVLGYCTYLVFLDHEDKIYNRGYCDGFTAGRNEERIQTMSTRVQLRRAIRAQIVKELEKEKKNELLY